MPPRKRRPAPVDEDEDFEVGQVNQVLDKIDNLFNRVAGGVDRLAGMWGMAQAARQRFQPPPPSAEAPRKPPPGAPPPPKAPIPPVQAQAYAQALKLFGWKAGAPFTKAMVKARRTELLAVFHPDGRAGAGQPVGDDDMFKRISAAATILKARAKD